MQVVQELAQQVWQWCETFGGTLGKEYIKRENISPRAFEDGGAFFACIQPEEAPSGAYHDFSFVVFPDPDGGASVVSLCIGTLGFRNDYELATQPGLRRRFLKLINENGYIKTDFTDMQSKLDESFLSNVPHLIKTLRDPYGQLIPACNIIPDLHSENSLTTMKAMLALYADIRGWATNNKQRKAVFDAITAGSIQQPDGADETLVHSLLLERRFVVLQGAPGTGKTRLAKRMAEKLHATTFFTQFHAEQAMRISSGVSALHCPAAHCNMKK